MFQGRGKNKGPSIAAPTVPGVGNTISTDPSHIKNGSSKKHIVKSAELIDKKKIKVGDIISHKLNITKFEKALKLINSSTSTKIIIKF